LKNELHKKDLQQQLTLTDVLMHAASLAAAANKTTTDMSDKKQIRTKITCSLTLQHTSKRKYS